MSGRVGNFVTKGHFVRTSRRPIVCLVSYPALISSMQSFFVLHCFSVWITLYHRQHYPEVFSVISLSFKWN